jgi:hypothetical protein
MSKRIIYSDPAVVRAMTQKGKKVRSRSNLKAKRHPGSPRLKNSMYSLGK